MAAAWRHGSGTGNGRGAVHIIIKAAK